MRGPWQTMSWTTTTAREVPDPRLPEAGHTLSAISVRTTADADLVEILVRLRERGAEVITVNSFPATRGEPGVTRVFDIEFRDLPAAAAADAASHVPGCPSRGVAPDPRPGLRQACHRHRGRGPDRAGEPGRGVGGGSPQPARRAHLGGHHRAGGRAEHRHCRACRGGPAARPHPGAGRLHHGRRHHQCGTRAAGHRHPGRSR